MAPTRHPGIGERVRHADLEQSIAIARDVSRRALLRLASAEQCISQTDAALQRLWQYITATDTAAPGGAGRRRSMSTPSSEKTPPPD